MCSKRDLQGLLSKNSSSLKLLGQKTLPCEEAGCFDLVFKFVQIMISGEGGWVGVECFHNGMEIYIVIFF